MRRLLAWVVEQVCRLADTQVCAIANLTDEDSEFVSVSSKAASGRGDLGAPTAA